MSDAEENSGYVRLKVVRGSVDSVSLFEITDWELEVLEKGSSGSTVFNFGVFFLSTGLSFLASLLTLTTNSIRVYIVFVIVTILGIGSGVVLLSIWKKFGVSTTHVCTRIRARVPTIDGTQHDNESSEN